MNSTAEEFSRALKLAFGDNVQESAGGVLLSDAQSTLLFEFGNATRQNLGALKIQLLRVQISVISGDEAAAKDLLARVDRATLRGGG